MKQPLEDPANRAARFIETLRLRGMRSLYEARVFPPQAKVLPIPRRPVGDPA